MTAMPGDDPQPEASASAAANPFGYTSAETLLPTIAEAEAIIADPRPRWSQLMLVIGLWWGVIFVLVVALTIVQLMGLDLDLELILLIPGVGAAGMFLCGMFLAYGPTYLWLRTLLVVAVQAMLLGAMVIASGNNGAPPIGELIRFYFGICMVPMTIGVLLTLFKLMGYTLLNVVQRRSNTTSTQFSIGRLIELTLVCAVGFAAAKWVEDAEDLFEIYWVVGLVVLGQGIPALVLLVPRFSAVLCGGITVGLWLLLLGVHAVCMYLQNDLSDFTGLACFDILAVNVLAMGCYLLRARGYRLMHFASTSV